MIESCIATKLDVWWRSTGVNCVGSLNNLDAVQKFNHVFLSYTNSTACPFSYLFFNSVQITQEQWDMLEKAIRNVKRL